MKDVVDSHKEVTARYLLDKIQELEAQIKTLSVTVHEIREKFIEESAIRAYLRNNRVVISVFGFGCFVVGVLANDVNIVKAILGR